MAKRSRARLAPAIPRPKRDAIGDKPGFYPEPKPEVQRPGTPSIGWKGLGVYRHVLSSTSKASAKAARPTRVALDGMSTAVWHKRDVRKRFGKV